MRHVVEKLKRRHEFLRVSRANDSVSAHGFVLQACSASQFPETVRVGFTASRKIGNAVKRNRARRRLRATVIKVMPLHAAPGYDYVVIARAGTAETPFDTLVCDLESALKKLNAWRKE